MKVQNLLVEMTTRHQALDENRATLYLIPPPETPIVLDQKPKEQSEKSAATEVIAWTELSSAAVAEVSLTTTVNSNNFENIVKILIDR